MAETASHLSWLYFPPGDSSLADTVSESRPVHAETAVTSRTDCDVLLTCVASSVRSLVLCDFASLVSSRSGRVRVVRASEASQPPPPPPHSSDLPQLPSALETGHTVALGLGRSRNLTLPCKPAVSGVSITLLLDLTLSCVAELQAPTVAGQSPSCMCGYSISLVSLLGERCSGDGSSVLVWISTCKARVWRLFPSRVLVPPWR